MRIRAFATLLCVLAAAGLSVPTAPAAAAPSTAPAAKTGLSASATPNQGRSGSRTWVVGANWPANARLQLVTCGALAIGGSPSCDMSAAYTVIASAGGAFGTEVTFGRPPAPCPCVIDIAAGGSGAHVDIPVVLTGHRSAPPPAIAPAPSASALTVLSANLVGWGTWQALFGAAAQRTVVLAVRNNSASPLSFSVRLASSAGPDSGSELAEQTLGPLPAHQRGTYRIPVSLDAGFGGSLKVHGTINGTQAFSASGSSCPWGMYLLILLVIGLLLFWYARRIRRARRLGHHRSASTQVVAKA